MYRILILDKDNKNEFYMLDKETVYEGTAQEVAAKAVELMDTYPLSRLNIVENSLEVLNLDLMYNDNVSAQQVEDYINSF